MTAWREVRLGDVCELKRGYDLPSARRRPGEIPIVSSSGTTGWHDTAKVSGPGVVTGRYGTLGEVFFVEDDFWPLNTALYVRDFRGNVRRFVYYLLQATNLGSSEGATAVPGVNRNVLHELKVRQPDGEAQHRIADVLTAFDELIENNRRRIEILEETARSLYREWFVRYRFPGHESAEFVDSLLGSIPEGWSTDRLDGFVSVIRGRSYRKHELVEDGGVPFLNLKCMVRGGGFRRNGLKRYAGEFKLEQRAEPGEIVLAVTDLTQAREIVARPALVPNLDEGFGVISLDLVRIVPVDQYDRLYLYWHMRESDFPHRLKEQANGTTVLHLAPAAVGQSPVLAPPQHLRRAFSERVEPLTLLAEELGDQIQVVVAARDLLLPKLVTGKIDVESLGVDDVFGWGELASELAVSAAQ